MNFSRFIERWADFGADRIALHCAGEDLSYGQLWQRIEAATPGLARELGVRRGHRIAFLGYNDPELLVLLFALARLGAVLVPMNFRLAVPELAQVLRHAEVTTLLVNPDFAEQAEALRAEIAGLRLVWLSEPPAGGLSWPEITQGGAPVACEGDDRDDLMIVYTSGTTGRPKGAVHTQEGMLWNIICSLQAHDLTSSDHVLMSLPMFHVGGLCIQTLPALYAGGRVTIHPRFDPGAWLRDVAERRPEISLLVPATVRAVLEHPDWLRTDLSSLRLINMGSSVPPTSYLNAFLERGIPAIQVYGATETGPVSILLRPEDAYRKVGSTGKPSLHCEVRLVAPDGTDVARGEVGEIWLRAKNMMRGYWKDPENPAYRDGWFHTGDLARQDEEGFYWIAGRSKDMIISGGENIYPAEIENIIAESPDVIELAVVGRPDARWGEVAVAMIVKKPGSTLESAAVLAMLEGRLARYKHPREVIFVDGLPKTALGKVQKSDLAALFQPRS